MAAILEIVIVPIVLLTVVVFLMVKASLSVASVAAGVVFLGLAYFIVIKLMRFMRRSDLDAEASDRRSREQAELQARGH